MDGGVNLNYKYQKDTSIKQGVYISVAVKFYLSHIIAVLWTAFSVYLSLRWLQDLSSVISFPAALIVIGGIAYIPGYLNAFLVMSLILDRQQPAKVEYPQKDVTIMIAARNEADRIADTLKYIALQDYSGKIHVKVIDNGSSDNTRENALKAGRETNLDIMVLREDKPGKFNALNTGLRSVSTDLVITLDADTILHKSAVRYLVGRIESAPDNICAVAGSVLVRNSRKNLLTRVQEWDYFLGIASIKRLQGLYQGTLVAQGAYSIYKTKAVKKVDGWPDAIGEDIVLTWRLLKQGWKVYFEPKSVAFTDVPETFKAFIRQRSRWARGMIEALRQIKPWQQPAGFVKYLTGINLLMPYLDVSYTLFWLPGLILALFGVFWIVGPATLLVIPLTLVSYSILYMYQKRVFKELDLKVRKNFRGFIAFVLLYQMIMSPVSVFGYLQEFLGSRRIWK